MGEETAQRGHWLVLGVTGRLGRAVTRALGADHVVGIARKGTDFTTQMPTFRATARRDVANWADLLARVDTVVDLCAFDADDADALLQAADRTGVWPRLVVAGSLADRPPSAWSLPDDASAPLPDPADAYAAGKRAAADLLLARWRGPVVVAALPQLFTAHDPQDRVATWLRTGARNGVLAVPGTGEQHPAWLVVEEAAAVLIHLGRRPDATGRIATTHPVAMTARAMATTLAAEAKSALRLEFTAAGGPWSAGDECPHRGKAATILADYAWQDRVQSLRDFARRVLAT